MELLIPGLILVALMVYASTKIKKSAAKAFEAEQIETDQFSISKPEGLLSRVDPKPPFVFEAYSKALGEKPFENIRQVTAEIRTLQNTDVANATNAVKNAVETVTSEKSLNDGYLIEADEVRDEAATKGFYKIVRSNGDVFSLHISALKVTSDESLRKIEEMLDTFVVK